MAMTLGEIAVRYGLELAGDPGQQVDGVAPLAAAAPGKLSFCSGPKYRKQLAATRATAVVLSRELAGECPVAALVSRAALRRLGAHRERPAPAAAGAAPGVHRARRWTRRRWLRPRRGSGRTRSSAPAP